MQRWWRAVCGSRAKCRPREGDVAEMAEEAALKLWRPGTTMELVCSWNPNEWAYHLLG